MFNEFFEMLDAITSLNFEVVKETVDTKNGKVALTIFRRTGSDEPMAVQRSDENFVNIIQDAERAHTDQMIRVGVSLGIRFNFCPR